MNGAAFLRTLRILGFPEVEDYNPSDFDAMCSEPELQQFLNYICTFNEDNILTTEELNAYAAIPPEELSELEKLASEEKCYIDEQAEDEKEDEAEFLKDQLSLIERRYKSLLEQKELLIKHQSFVMDEKEECQNIVISLKRIYEDYTLNKIPLAKAELFKTLQSVTEVFTELKLWINTADENSCANLKDLEDYFEEENKIINFIQIFMQNNFQFKSKENMELDLSVVSNEDLVKEISVLENVLKKTKLSELQAVCDYKKRKAVEKFFKNYDEGLDSQMTEASSSQLSVKLSEELQKNKKLKQKEEQLISYVFNAISDHLKAQCSEIAIAHSNDTLLAYKQCMKTIEFPLLYMLDQRSRLELFIFFINSHQNNLKNMKLFIDKISDFLSVEENTLLERKEKLKQSCDKIPGKENNSPQSSVLSCCKTLNPQSRDADYVNLPIIVSEIQQLYKELAEQKNDKSYVIRSLENRYSDMAKYVLKGMEFSKFMKLEKLVSTQINHLDLLATEMHTIFTGFKNSWTDKNKLLETKRNLQLGRSLYILALLDQKKFEETIEKIKKASENSVKFFD